MHGQPGEQVRDDREAAVSAWKRLKALPEEQRRKKEAQLQINLAKAVEALGDSLLDEGGPSANFGISAGPGAVPRTEREGS